MAFAQGSRSNLAYTAESTFGTTPSNTTLAYLPINSHSLDLTKERVQGNEIQSDRMPRVDRHGNRQVGGTIECDLRKGDFDELLESAMMGSFTSDVLKVGSTAKFFTMEDGALDIDYYRAFTGCHVGGMTVSMAPNQMVTASFDIIGKNMTISQASASADSGGTENTPSASSTNAPFDSYKGDVREGGTGSSDVISLVTSLEFSITNNLSPTFIVGADSAQAINAGRAIVEGTMTCYYEDNTLINKFLNETESSLQVSVDDPTDANPYTFNFPRIKYNGASVPLADESSRIITLPFIALYDTSEGTNLKITRTS